MNNVKISVLIPSYNHAPYIGQAIESVINQTFKDIEILIGDDCSTDNSKDVINSYSDSRIKKFFSKTNCGGSENLNKLISLANGEYIAILNSDDYWELDKLEKQYKFLEENKSYAACFTWVQYMDRNGNKTFPENVFIQENKTQAEWLRYFFENGNCLCHPSVLIRRKIYNEIESYKFCCRQIPDFILWIKLVQKYPIYIMPDSLVNFRWSGDEKNTSGFSVGNMNRTYHEYHMLAQEVFDECSIDLLCEAFYLDKEKCKKSDVLYDYGKNMVLFNSRIFGNIGKMVAYSNIGRLLNDMKSREVLEKEENFSINDFFKMGEDLTFHTINIVDRIEKVPDNIAYSRGYKALNKLYRTRIYNFIKKFR